MYEVIFLWVLALAFILFAVVQDIRTREIANWLNFSLIIFALGFRLFYSLFSGDNFSFFLNGLMGFGIFFVVGNLFYYSRLFAGGDAKLMIALGTILPISSRFFSNIQIFLNFLLIFLMSGFVYIVFASISLCLKNFKAFQKEFIKQFKISKKIFYFSLLVSSIFLIASLFEIFFLFVGILIFFTFWLYLYSKAIDECCMIKEISTKYLREGDWLYSNTKVGKKTIKKSWDGVTKKEIKEILKYYKKVKIREGVVFSPVFLMAIIIWILSILFKINLWDSLW
jgi:Flp pilus assembly protein protease CpaA